MLKLVSILIVNYRSYAEIRACLTSLREFCSGATEVIVVDHESDRAEAQGLGRDFPWARIIACERNPGFAAGVNRAARSSSGRYVLLLNPDCEMHGDVAGSLAAWMDAHPNVGVCGAQVREPDGSIQASARRFPDATTGIAGRTSLLTRLWPGNALSLRNLTTPAEPTGAISVDWVSGACMMIRRDAFDRVGGMDEGFFLYWEDADLCRRLLDAGWATAYNPVVSVTHLTSRSSARAPARSLIAFHRGAFRYFTKHTSRVGLLATPLVGAALTARLLFKLGTTGLTPPSRKPERAES